MLYKIIKIKLLTIRCSFGKHNHIMMMKLMAAVYDSDHHLHLQPPQGSASTASSIQHPLKIEKYSQLKVQIYCNTTTN